MKAEHWYKVGVLKIKTSSRKKAFAIGTQKRYYGLGKRMLTNGKIKYAYKRR
jgi:hypothetical protein